MESFARIGMGVMLLVGATVGVRLLLLSSKTHRLPELVMGAASLCIGVGSVGVVQGGEMAAAGHPLGSSLVLGGVVVTSFGGFFLCAGMWQIFRVGQSWAGGLTTLAGLILLGSCIALFLAAPGPAPITDLIAYRIGISVRIFAFAWVAVESLLYASKLKRRAALGLAKPLMVHRFICWGASSATATVGYLIFLGSTVSGSQLGSTGQLVLGLLGVITGATMWTAFFPPGFYRRWVEADSPHPA